MNRLELWNVVAIYLLTGCSSSQEKLELRCRPIVENILKIQDHREVLRKDFSLTREGYQGDTISYTTFSDEFERWSHEESALNLEVSELYNQAYEERCL